MITRSLLALQKVVTALIEKRVPQQLSSVESTRGWWPIIRESWAGAWQSNVEVTLTDVLTHPTVFACIDLISSDVAKMGLRLVQEVEPDIWVPIENSAYSPVLRKPNHYQRIQFPFIKLWMISKLTHGNTYALKARDARGVVQALYILDPQRVRPLVAPDGSVYYEVKRDDLSQQHNENLIIPASEIIHDVCTPLYHPLVGLSPLYASGLAAVLGLKILNNSAVFFSNGSNPGGILMAPGAISAEAAARIKAYWEANFSGDNTGKIAVLGDDMKYQPMTISADNSQLTDQWEKVAEAIAATFHVPFHLVGGPPPPYNNIQALIVQYFTQCLQAHTKQLEDLLDDGLGLQRPLGTEFDVYNLLWMDTDTMMSVATKAVGGGIWAPNEARRRFNLLGMEGGDTVYMQQQQFSLAALAERDRDKPFAKPQEPSPAASAEMARDGDVTKAMYLRALDFETRAMAEGLHAA